MTLPVAITPGDPGHIDDHEEAHELLGRLDGQTTFTATGVSQGLLADRPAAAASNEGLIYHATDVPATFYSDGSTWTQWALAGDSITWTGIHNHDEDVFFGSGRPWYDVMHEDYGATGDGTTDDTAAIQAAIDAAEAVSNGSASGATVFLPPGEYLTTAALTIESSNISIVGAGTNSSRITNTTTDVFHLGTATTAVHQLRFEAFRIDASGGHIFDVLDQISACTFRDVFLIQNGDGFSAWRKDNDRDMIWCLFDHCRWQHTNSATVPTIDLRGDLVSVNEWRHNESINTGNYWLWAEPSTAGASHWNNQVRGLFCEQTTGGMVKMMASRAALIEDVSVFDLQNVSSLQRDGIVVGESAAGTRSFSATIRRYVRAGGSLAAGVFDINTEGSQGETIEKVGGTGDTPEVKLGTSWHSKVLSGVGANITGGRESLIQIGYGATNGTMTLGDTELLFGTGDGAPTHAAPDGSLYLRRDGGAGEALYVREDGSWVAK